MRRLEDADAAVTAYDNYHTGPTGQKNGACLVSPEENPNSKENVLRYTEFVQKHAAAQPTSTVLVFNLPNAGPISNVNQMLEKLCYEDLEYEDGEKHGLLNIRISAFKDGVLAKFESVDDAAHFFHCYDGEYWKNNTLHVEFRPDSEIPGPNQGKSVLTQSTKLWVNNTGGVTDEQIRNAFHPTKLHDMTRTPKSCLVFLEMVNALRMLDDYPNGKKLPNGRKIFFREDKKDDAKFALARAARPSIPAAPNPHAYRPLPAPAQEQPALESVTAKTEVMDLGAKETSVKVSNVSDWTSNADIRDLFKNYRLSGKGVSGKKGSFLVSMAKTSRLNFRRHDDFAEEVMLLEEILREYF